MKKVYALYGATGIIKIFASKNKAENLAKEWNFQTSEVTRDNKANYYVVAYEIE